MDQMSWDHSLVTQLVAINNQERIPSEHLPYVDPLVVCFVPGFPAVVVVIVVAVNKQYYGLVKYGNGGSEDGSSQLWVTTDFLVKPKQISDLVQSDYINITTALMSFFRLDRIIIC